MRAGELFVEGKNSITIDLGSRLHPDKVEVHFKHHQLTIHPCDPGRADDLQWSVVLGGSGNYLLTIIWDVSVEREIKWEACW